MKKIILTISVALLSISGFSQDFLSVEEYREKVLNYSQQLKQSEENVTASLADIKDAKSNLLPKVDAAANFNYLINKINFELGPGQKISIARLGYGVSATVAQNVYSGGIVQKQIDALEIKNEIAEHSLEQARENICYAADLNYWRLAAMESFRKAAIDYRNLILENYKIIKDRYDDGLISKNDLLMIETRIQDAEYMLSDTEKQYDDAVISINVLMGAPVDNKITLKDSLLTVEAVLPQYKDLDYALNNRSEYKISEKQIDIANQSLKITRAQYLPQLALGVTGQFATSSINITGDGIGAGIVFGQLKIPIFAGNSKKHKTASMNAKIRQTNYEKQNVIDNINKELSVAWSGIINTYKQIDLANNNLKISQESLDLNTYSYNEGVLTLLDVLSSQISWLNAYNNLISTKFSFIQAQAAYNKAIGEY